MAEQSVIRNHRRFALRDVMIGGVPVGGATIDSWHDATTERWCARLLLSAQHPFGNGILEGLTADGRRVRGTVRIGDISAGPRGRQVMAELLGESPLVEVTEDAAGEEPPPEA